MNGKGTTDPEEYKRRHYKKGGYHWETSGVHAYAVLQKYSKKPPVKKEAVEVRGLSRKDEKCNGCNKKINKGNPIKKIDGVPYHIKCR